MGIMDVKSAVAEIGATTDMLERALKLSGFITTMFPSSDVLLWR